jgi:hypothetical protein
MYTYAPLVNSKPEKNTVISSEKKSDRGQLLAPVGGANMAD